MAGRKRGSQSERCGICLHEKVGSINYSLVRGTPHSAIYREYGFHHTTIRNHLRDHIGENYKRIIGAGIYRDIDDLLKQCVDGNAESLDVLNAMISGLFHSWGVAVSNNATQQIASLAA